jgi:hypothetical protein
MNMELGLQMLNVFNDSSPEYYSSWALFQGQEFTPSSWVSPRRLQVKLKLMF